jgi:hypothetical protein
VDQPPMSDHLLLPLWNTILVVYIFFMHWSNTVCPLCGRCEVANCFPNSWQILHRQNVRNIYSLAIQTNKFLGLHWHTLYIYLIISEESWYFCDAIEDSLLIWKWVNIHISYDRSLPTSIS